jgi:putative transposase
MLKTFKYRLYPSRTQEINLFRVLNACRGLYNMALAARKYAYQLEERRDRSGDGRRRKDAEWQGGPVGVGY